VTSFDVIIVGAGPVGLMLANQLQRRQVNYCLLEARDSRQYWCKAMGVSPRSLEIFDQMGLIDPVLQRGLFLTAVNVVVKGQVQKRIEIPQGAYPYGNMALSQFDTEEILEAALVSHGGRIEWRTQVTAIRRLHQHVEVDIQTPTTTQTLIAHWLVGCDGAHSLVRKSQDIAFEGGSYEQQFLLGDVEIGWDRPHSEVWRFINQSPEGQFQNLIMAVPIPGNPRRYRLSLAVPSETEERDPLSLLQELAAPALPPGTPIENLRWGSFYRISHRLASHYRKGRVFLAGDAAHIHPPTGGLGMNTGLQDAHNLGWKLASVCRGEALESLLDSYEAERLPVGQQVVELTSSRMDDLYRRHERDPQQEERANTQLYVDYCQGPLAHGQVPPGDCGAQPGQRLDCLPGLTHPYLNRQARLIDLLRNGEFHLFGYGCGGNWTDFSQLTDKLRHYFGHQLHSWALLSDPQHIPPNVENTAFLIDSQGLVPTTWGAGPGALLVRPDGFVAWRGRPTFDESLNRLLSLVSLNHS